MNKKGMIKSDHFAKKIIKLAAEEGLTVAELRKAADVVKGIADYPIIAQSFLYLKEKYKQGDENVGAVFEKELPKSEKIEIVREIIKIFREKEVTFGQAFELLSDVQVEIQKISLSKSS